MDNTQFSSLAMDLLSAADLGQLKALKKFLDATIAKQEALAKKKDPPGWPKLKNN